MSHRNNSRATTQASPVPFAKFLDRKSQHNNQQGFEPSFLPDVLYDFQEALTAWAITQGRAAILADCGLGKTLMELVWAENVRRQTNKPTLILTPLAVGAQIVHEGVDHFGIDAGRSRDGVITNPNIVVTNYEKLHLFNPQDFGGVVCDESSILKHYAGATQKAVTSFLLKMPYRLTATATAAPNDYVEIGTQSEALGELGMIDMLSRFFSMAERKSVIGTMKSGEKRGVVVSKTGAEWHLKPHAEQHFWRWVTSWARACRKPSDLGFSDDRFVLPELTENEHTVTARTLANGQLFALPAFGLQEEREERRRTMQERCEYVADLVRHDKPAVVWCHLNDEGNLLQKLIPGSRQVKGGDTDDEKESAFTSFADGSTRVLITKPKIGAWGLNWQHCAHVVTFASHSYEQYYQSVRRCWRFGQTQPVTVDIVSTEGEVAVRENMKRKSEQAAKMFASLVEHMNNATVIKRRVGATKVQVPNWLSTTK